MNTSLQIARGVYQAELKGYRVGGWPRFRTMLEHVLVGGLTGYEFVIARKALDEGLDVPRTVIRIEDHRGNSIRRCKGCAAEFLDVGDLSGNRSELCDSCLTQWEREQMDDLRAAVSEAYGQDYD